MVLSALVLEDDRRRRKGGSGRAEGLLACGEKLFHGGTIFSVIWCVAPAGLPPFGPGLTDDHGVHRQEDNPSDPSWRLNEPGRLYAVLCVCDVSVSTGEPLRLSLVRPLQVKEH